VEELDFVQQEKVGKGSLVEYHNQRLQLVLKELDHRLESMSAHTSAEYVDHRTDYTVLLYHKQSEHIDSQPHTQVVARIVSVTDRIRAEQHNLMPGLVFHIAE
jgi:hypothetical protein